LPLGVPQILIHGARDPIVPLELGRQYEEAATKMGDDVRLVTLEEAAHFEVIAPQSPAWRSVAEAVRTVLSRP
jgi:pimeloyl-ACP methyl ester carboxylesterase